MFQHFTDAQLMAEIGEYRDALKKAAFGGGVQRVAGEGRSVTILGADTGALRDMLRALIAEAVGRGLMTATGGTIMLEIG